MPDRRLFNSSSMVPPPEPRVDISTLTNALDEGFMPDVQSYPEFLGAIQALGSIIDQASRPRGDGIEFVIDTDLPKGWCQFTGLDGHEYAGPLSRMPAGALSDRMRIASDLWEDLRRLIKERA